MDEVDALGDHEVFGNVPARAIQDQEHVLVLAHADDLRELGEHGTHGGRVDPAKSTTRRVHSADARTRKRTSTGSDGPRRRVGGELCLFLPHTRRTMGLRPRRASSWLQTSKFAAGERPARPLPRRRAFLKAACSSGLAARRWRGSGHAQPKAELTQVHAALRRADRASGGSLHPARHLTPAPQPPTQVRGHGGFDGGGQLCALRLAQQRARSAGSMHVPILHAARPLRVVAADDPAHPAFRQRAGGGDLPGALPLENNHSTCQRRVSLESMPLRARAFACNSSALRCAANRTRFAAMRHYHSINVSLRSCVRFVEQLLQSRISSRRGSVWREITD